MNVTVVAAGCAGMVALYAEAPADSIGMLLPTFKSKITTDAMAESAVTFAVTNTSSPSKGGFGFSVMPEITGFCCAIEIAGARADSKITVMKDMYAKGLKCALYVDY